MTKERLKKTLRGVLIIIGIFVIIGSLANWYVSNRLDNFLNKKLAESVSEATNGFYTFSFEDFSVGFFNGELMIKGIQLKPDSAVLREWAAIDSLPKTFFKIDIGSIDFKGLNLKWRISYSDLHFDVFEIQSPHIEIFDIYNSRQYNYKTKKFSPKDLYETVSPYLNTVTVKQINLEKAYVSYTVEDSIDYTIYKLDDFNFHAYGFRLDENSASSGKLLYSDNFNFKANTPQTLLSNSQLELNTDNIELNTQDSIIQIDNIKIIPHISSKDSDIVHEDYLEAEIKTIAVRGISFRRENALTYLTTRSFDILSTDMHYYNVVQEKPKKDPDSKQEKIAKADSIIQNWSLYGMISPILYSIEIGQIKIADAKFKYSAQNKDHTDVYDLDKFDFLANNFKVDSTVNTRNKLVHSDNFILNAIGIHGYIPSKNHILDISGMSLNTVARQFEITDIKLKPISTKTRSDYLFGTVTSVKLEGLDYNTGIDADLLEIKDPRVDYSMTDNQRYNSSSDKKSPNQLDQSDVINLLEPIINHLAVKKIDINNAYFTFNDKITSSKYNLLGFNFYATDFLIDQNTRLTKKYYFTCENFGLRFYNFDNILPNKDYRLTIKNGVISGMPGRLTLKGVNLIPLKINDGPYLSMSIPLIDIEGIDYNFNDKGKEKKLRIKSFDLISPHISYMVQNKEKYEKKEEATTSVQQFLQDIDIASINISDANFNYSDKVTKESLGTKLESLRINNLRWANNRNISTTSFVLQRINTVLSKPESDSKLNIEKMNLSDIDWGLQKNMYLNLAKIDIQEPVWEYTRLKNELKPVSVNKKDTVQKDFYSALGKIRDRLVIGKFNISNANADFIYVLNNDTLRDRMINNTNFSFEKLAINTTRKSVTFDNLHFETKQLQYPLANNFYTLKADDIYISQKDSLLNINNLHLVSPYSKMEFAYKHPKHKDWFDVSTDNIKLQGIDFGQYFNDNTIKIRNAYIKNTDLRNFKNQQIEIEHNVMPLIYEGLQKAPVKMDIGNIGIENFNVFYEELAKKGTFPGKIFFRNMNATVTGFTNIIKQPDQYIDLHTSGIFLDSAPFEARWMIPVSPTNDRFILQGHIHKFNLKELNQIFIPLASAEVKSGTAQDVIFSLEASSKEAVIDMRFLYKNLDINIYKDVEEDKSRKFLTGLANLVIRDNNPRHENSEPKISHQLKVKRDPYHSTFNYFWQILKPATIEAVGVPKTGQDIATGISGFFKKVKNFFSFGKKKKQEQKENKEDSDFYE